MSTTVSSYIYPPRPETAVPRAETDRPDSEWSVVYGFQAQYKYNGSRCVVVIKPGIDHRAYKIELWNRHKERMKYVLTTALEADLIRIARKLSLDPTKTSVLDCELMHNAHSALKNTLVLFDILSKNDKRLVGTTYGERHADLLSRLSSEERYLFQTDKSGHIDLGMRIGCDMLLAELHSGYKWPDLWKTVDTINASYATPILEGVVLKKPTGVLEKSLGEKNNGAWMVRSRIETKRHRF